MNLETQPWNIPALYLKATSKLLRTYKKTPNTGESNARRKRETPKKHRKTKYILREGCGGLDGGKCLESGTNSRISADVWNTRQGSNVRKRLSKREEWHYAQCIVMLVYRFPKLPFQCYYEQCPPLFFHSETSKTLETQTDKNETAKFAMKHCSSI